MSETFVFLHILRNPQLSANSIGHRYFSFLIMIMFLNRNRPPVFSLRNGQIIFRLFLVPSLAHCLEIGFSTYPILVPIPYSVFAILLFYVVLPKASMVKIVEYYLDFNGITSSWCFVSISRLLWWLCWFRLAISKLVVLNNWR